MISKIERQFFDTFGIEPKTNQVYIDEFFNKQLSNILEKVKLNELGWKDFMIDTSENRYTLQTSWKYEFEKYNLLHCYKMIDWDKYYLCLIGG